MANVSVERFRKLTQALKDEVFALAIAELNDSAEDLARIMRSVVAFEEGDLRESIKVIPDKAKATVVRVVAGSGKTMVRSGAKGRPYNYARAVEFGTVDTRAQPFFFPTYRLRKKKMRTRMKRKITASIKKRSAE